MKARTIGLLALLLIATTAQAQRRRYSPADQARLGPNRYCTRANCSMCNAIWGPMYAQTSPRIIRTQVREPREPDPTPNPWDAPDFQLLTTPHNVVASMLKLAAITPEDVVYDLGCGDGRIVIAAARDYGARSVGIELNPETLAKARASLARSGLSHLVRVYQGDVRKMDFSPATVITVYLYPELLEELVPKIPPGCNLPASDRSPVLL